MTESMLRVLFVDDEQAVLDGLRNRFRRQRNRWLMEFAPGGQQAIDALRREPFDVVVTDMRMPHVDGVELLEHVHANYPSVLRIVLSGHSETDAVLRVAPIAHRYLSKPCDAVELEQVIERAIGLRTIVSSDRVKRTVGTLKTLPAVPRLYVELTRALKNEDATIMEIGHIIATDVAMSVKVLQLANSGLFHRGAPVVDIDQALRRLGMDTTRFLVLSAGLFAGAAERTNGPAARAQRHGLAVARLACDLLAEPARSSEAFLAGMLHDVGRFALEASSEHDYSSVAAVMSTRGLSRTDAEHEVYGAAHAEAGAYLLELWGLPQAVAEVAAFHHEPALLDHDRFDVVDAVHVADALVHELDPSEHPATPPLDVAWLVKLGVAGRLPAFRERAAAITAAKA